MVIEFFKFFVMCEIVVCDFVGNVKVVKCMVECGDECIWDILEEVIKEYLVFLNCVFIFYRLGI